MSKNNYRFISGPDLLSFLSFTSSPVKYLNLSGKVMGHLEPAAALLIAKSGSFTGKCTASRCVSIREVDTRVTVSNPTYWDGRACGLYRWPSTPVTKDSVAIWEKAGSRLESRSA